jgi:hypothetical protein
VPVPDLSILGPSANQQNDGGQDDGEEDNDTRTSQSALLARRTQRGPLSKSFEEVGYQNVRSCEDAGEDMYFEDTQWKKNHLMVQTSSLNLFIFADEYSVYQLRDDVITALLGQANTLHWSPDPNQELITKAYGNLPESAKFHKLMVHCTAHRTGPRSRSAHALSRGVVTSLCLRSQPCASPDHSEVLQGERWALLSSC